MRITFYGAAQTTTGSMHLVEANGKRILLDALEPPVTVLPYTVAAIADRRHAAAILFMCAFLYIGFAAIISNLRRMRHRPRAWSLPIFQIPPIKPSPEPPNLTPISRAIATAPQNYICFAPFIRVSLSEVCRL